MKNDKQFPLPDMQALAEDKMWAGLAQDWRSAEEECEVPASFRIGWREKVRSEAMKQTEFLKEELPGQNEGSTKEESDVQTESVKKKTRLIPLHVKRWLAAAAAVVFLTGGTLMTRDRLGGKPSGRATAPRGTTYASASFDAMGSNAIDYSMDKMAAAAPQAYSMQAPESAEDVNAASKTQNGQKLIRTVRLKITTPAFDDDMKLASDTVSNAGGYVESSDVQTGAMGYRSASLVLRIPQDKLDSAVEHLRGIGRLESFSESSEDVTETYTDTQTRLETAKVKLKRLQELLSKAQTTEDLLKIEDALADAQYETDSLTGRLNRMDKQINYATVALKLREETPKDTSEKAPTLGERMASALRLAWEDGVDFLSDMLVFIVGILPFAAAAAAVILIAKRLIKRRKKK